MGTLGKKTLVFGVGVAVCSAIALLCIALLQKSPHTPQGAINDVVTTTVDVPSEEQPPATYAVPATHPLSIEIQKRNIKGYIQRVGIDQFGAVAAPNNIHKAGWFVDSVTPGQKGLSIIDGHEGGPTMDGIFKHLTDVAIGDQIIITMGDKSQYTYQVFEREVLAEEASASALFNQSPQSIDGQLNVITCTGLFDEKTQTYNKRVIVYAKRIV